jgi:hypothetical protein
MRILLRGGYERQRISVPSTRPNRQRQSGIFPNSSNDVAGTKATLPVPFYWKKTPPMMVMLMPPMQKGCRRVQRTTTTLSEEFTLFTRPAMNSGRCCCNGATTCSFPAIEGRRSLSAKPNATTTSAALTSTGATHGEFSRPATPSGSRRRFRQRCVVGSSCCS